MPCTDPDYGRYIGGGCYWKAANPPPDSPPPAGADPNGVWGVQTCYAAPGVNTVTQSYRWMVNGSGVTPAQLAARALAKIHLEGARIGIEPSTAGSGLVGLPVWLWTAVTAGTWGPLSASATDGGITVTITAKAQRIVWSMGDGSHVTCTNPGTAYRPGAGASPNCGYTYRTPSSTTTKPHGRYTVTATTYWTATWTGGGQSGALYPTSQAQTSVEIDELQVVTQ